jgi:hypothetical protein
VTSPEPQRPANPKAGMSADTLARDAASDANLAGIVAGRRRAAAALLVPDHAPANKVRDNWEPKRQEGDR